MEYLIWKGATLSCKDDSGRTPLEYAWITCMTFSTFILLKYGGRMSGEHLDKYPWRFLDLIKHRLPSVHLFQLLLSNNFEFRKLLPVNLEKLRNIKWMNRSYHFWKSLSNLCHSRTSVVYPYLQDTGVQFMRSIDTLDLPKLLQGFLMLDDLDQSVRLPTEF